MTRTRLDRFVDEHQIEPEKLATAAGLTPSAIERLRLEDGNPTLTAMRAIRDACRQVTGLKVQVTDLFDLGD